MNLKKIQEALSLPYGNDVIEQKIIDIIAKDENAIISVNKILNAERQYKAGLLNEMNLLLGKAKAGLEHPELNSDEFIQKQIGEFYSNHKEVNNPFTK